ncbi:MAG: phosphoribosyl-AMP cyclohydrolase [Candidatus Omnitrophica bacterium]|nr:phosphoribosyl-AMP cyclohydrolase [Candidatus Omnitrophota bacterium]
MKTKVKEQPNMEELKFGKDGLMPAIIQDAQNGEVLMMGYMNRESLGQTLKTRKTCFYSRSRNKLWVKGETSGHTQEVKEILTDCDRDTLLIRVTQKGGACHLGYRSCFVHQLDNEGKICKITEEKVFDPDKTYGV